MKDIQFAMDGEVLTLQEVGTYADGTPAIRIFDENEEPWCTLTVCVDGTELRAGEILVKDWSENARTYQKLVELGLLKPTGRTVPTGHVEAKVCKLAEYADVRLYH